MDDDEDEDEGESSSGSEEEFEEAEEGVVVEREVLEGLEKGGGGLRGFKGGGDRGPRRN